MIDKDQLRRDQEKGIDLEKSFNSNPVKVAIQNLFKTELSGSNYRKLSISTLKELIINKLQEASKTPGPYSSAVTNLISKVKKSKSCESILMFLNEYLFS